MHSSPTVKSSWSGTVLAVQARISLSRSFDERGHSYLGYHLSIRGVLAGDERNFLVAVGKAAHLKHQFQVGDSVSGEGLPVANPRIELGDIYKVSKLKVLSREAQPSSDAPPWHGPPPSLEVFRERRHRRLDARTFSSRCTTCIWGCRMPVEIIVDHWNPSVRKHRIETFCYGPLSCPLYRAGPTRKVPGRRGMMYEEEDWVDEEETRHRGPDD